MWIKLTCHVGTGFWMDIMLSFLLGEYLEMELLSHVRICVNLIRNLPVVFQSGRIILHSTRMLLYLCINTWYWHSFNFCHSSGCAMVCDCGYDFYNDWGYRTFFHVLLDHSLFVDEMSIQIFVQFLNWPQCLCFRHFKIDL